MNKLSLNKAEIVKNRDFMLSILPNCSPHEIQLMLREQMSKLKSKKNSPRQVSYKYESKEKDIS